MGDIRGGILVFPGAAEYWVDVERDVSGGEVGMEEMGMNAMIVVHVVIDNGNPMPVQGMIKTQIQHNGMDLVSRPILFSIKDMAGV